MKKIDDDLEKVVENLAETFIEELSTEQCEAADPFEAYFHLIEVQNYHNMDDFKGHVAHGFEVLVSEIADENVKEMNESETKEDTKKVKKK